MLLKELIYYMKPDTGIRLKQWYGENEGYHGDRYTNIGSVHEKGTEYLNQEIKSIETEQNVIREKGTVRVRPVVCIELKDRNEKEL